MTPWSSWAPDTLRTEVTFSFLAAQNNSTLSFPALVAILFAAAVVVSTIGSGITLRRFLKV